MLWPICQRYNLKAIHNTLFRLLRSLLVVTNMSKIQSESNSQLISKLWQKAKRCDQYVKDTIWKQFTTARAHTPERIVLWPICQRYNLKAIHNDLHILSKYTAVVTNMSKIQSESNSQQCFRYNSTICSCDQYVKDTIWKQFTTPTKSTSPRFRLWPICQRYNLKAIHNSPDGRANIRRVVTNMSKIQSESNSQLFPPWG